MKIQNSLLLLVIATVALVSCEGYPQPGQTQTDLYQRRAPQPRVVHDYDSGYGHHHRNYGFRDGSDYAPNLSEAYRLGYRCGSDDAFEGRGRNYSLAYRRYGSGWESYFQEGYADGYDGRRPRH